MDQSTKKIFETAAIRKNGLRFFRLCTFLSQLWRSLVVDATERVKHDDRIRYGNQRAVTTAAGSNY